MENSIPIFIDNLKSLPVSLIKNIKIKSPEEVERTKNESKKIERGFISNKLNLCLTIFCVFIFLFFPFISLIILFLFLVDYVIFLIQRFKKLRLYNNSELRLETSGDFEVINNIYDALKIKQPSMDDWEKAWGLSNKKKQWKIDLHYKVITDFYEKNQGSIEKILEIGTNDGRLCYKYGVGKNKLFFGVDISMDLLGEFYKNCDTDKYAILADGICLPIKKESVDFIICSEVLEHLSLPEKAIMEFERILKYKGFIIIQSPNAARIRNLNPFHILSCVLGLFMPFILLPKKVHENTWHTAHTYHWDFTRQDILRYVKYSNLKIIDIYGAFYTFNPSGNALNRILYHIFRRTPIINQLGGDLVIVLKKNSKGEKKNYE